MERIFLSPVTMDNKLEFQTEIKSTFKLAVPIIVAQLGVSLMGITDTIMIGYYLDKTALGIAGISGSVAYLIACLAVGGFHVISPLASKAKAEGDYTELKYLYHASLRIVFGFSITLTALMSLVCLNFELLQQPAEVNESAPLFLLIIALSFIPNYYFLGLKQVLDGLGKPEISMRITLLGLFFNVILNYLFINGVGFIAPLGIYGAAISTLFVRLIMTLAIYLAVRKNFDPRLEQVDYKRMRKLTTNLYKLTIPSGLALFFEVGAFTFTFVMMGWLGSTAMAAHQVSLNFISAVYMVSAGISYAGGIRVGEARGIRSIAKIKQAGNATIFLITIFMLSTGAAIMIWGKYVITLYIHEPEVIELSITLIQIAGALTILDGLQVGGLSLLRGLSDVNVPTLMTLIAYWLIALPFGYFLGFSLGMESEGIYYGLYSGLGVSAILVISRFYLLLPKYKFD